MNKVCLILIFVIGVMISNAGAQRDLEYSMYLTKVSTADGTVLSTNLTALETELQLRADAEAGSDSDVTVLIGYGDGVNAVTDIHIVGINGVAYGYIHAEP